MTIVRMHRRNFVKTAAALAGIAAIPGVSARAFAAPIAAVIFDERYADARHFADELVRRGARPFATRSNVARLWYDAAGRNIVPDGTRLAGFTPYSDLVVVQWIVACWNSRVLYEGVHDARRATTVSHSLTSATGHPQLVAALSGSSPNWPRALAAALCCSELAGARNRRTTIMGKAIRSNDFPGTLVSWTVGQA